MSGLYNLKDNFQENKLHLNRVIIAIIVIGLFFLLLLYRLFYLQIIQHDLYSTLSKKNHVKVIPTQPTRGLILDRNGILLAENIPTFRLEIQPYLIKNINDLINNISEILPISSYEIETFKKQLRYNGKYANIPLKNKLTEEEVAKFSVHKEQFPGVEIVAGLSRFYPHKELYAHIIGYVGLINEQDLQKIPLNNYRGTYQIGKSGIEKYYETLLHGNIGSKNIETNALGKKIRLLEQKPATSGQDINLTIDHRLQTIAYNVLKKRNSKGAIVALDVETGAVLTIISYPSFDPNLFVQGIDHQTYAKLRNDPDKALFDRSIKGQYPPGSTAKPLVALKALEEKIVTPETKIFDPGYYQLHPNGRLFRNWKRNGHGLVDLEKALAQSCTTYFYHVSHLLGIDNIYDIFSKFGMGEITNIDLPGEATGIAPSKKWKRIHKNEDWFEGETLNIGIGQGYTLATPLQIARNATTIATKGKVFKPYLADIESNKNITIKNIDLKNNYNWEPIVRGMIQAIKLEKGTAHRIYQNQANYLIAGKTGTSQVFSLKEDEKYISSLLPENLRDHSLFMGFAPAEQPKIALSVIIENSRGISSLVAKEIFDEFMRIQNDKK